MKQQISLSIEEELIEKIKIIAIKKKRNVSELVEEWIKNVRI